MTNFAESSSNRIGFIAETTEGTTPSTPAFSTMALTTDTLDAAKLQEMSETVRSDGNMANILKLGYNVAGNIAGEFRYGAFDSLLENVFGKSFSSDVLVNGRDRNSLSFERTVKTGSTNNYFRYTGLHANSFTLTMPSQGKVTFSADLVGMDHSESNAIITGATYAAATSNPPIVACAGFAGLTTTGLGSNVKVRQLELSVNNNIAPRPSLEKCTSEEVMRGQTLVSLSAELYFTDMAAYTAVMSHTDVSLQWTLGNDANEKYTFNLPKAKINAPAPNTGGNNTDIILNATIDTYIDSGIAGVIQVTRAVA